MSATKSRERSLLINSEKLVRGDIFQAIDKQVVLFELLLDTRKGEIGEERDNFFLPIKAHSLPIFQQFFPTNSLAILNLKTKETWYATRL